MSATQTQTAKPRGRVKVETGAKRVRAYLGAEPVADTAGPLLVYVDGVLQDRPRTKFS